MPGAQALRVAAEHAGLGEAVAPVLASEASQGVATEVDGADFGRQDDAAAGCAQAVVELVVLAAVDVLREAADALEDLASVGAEGHAVGLLRPGRDVAEGRVADAEAGGHRQGDGPADDAMTARLDGPADGIGAGLVQDAHVGADEVRRDASVAVQMDDDIAVREGEAEVASGGRRSLAGWARRRRSGPPPRPSSGSRTPWRRSNRRPGR